MKRETKKGLNLKKSLQESDNKEVPDSDQNVLTKCVFYFDGISEYNQDLPSPADSDYMIYFSIFMI